ncbi:MAG TPA: nucleoside triphosphate pyrophosphohydrolase [Balneolaceae bacterium]|nr:nucleoside triphosphate pyrophosphohydrolase [Balneolaceae bacterium]
MKADRTFENLVAIVKILRKECPWDRKQTHKSLKDNLIEEAYEAVEAIDNDDFDELEKELGDVLLHVVFHSNMASETNRFNIGDVIFSIQEKLIRRHPHVFGDAVVNNEQQVAENWESIKLNEGKSSVLEGIPKHLPGLIRAQRMQQKAGNVGFDWQHSPNGKKQVWEKLEEELQEFKEALEQGNTQKSREEFGDLLFSLVNVGRFFDLKAEDSLRLTNKKFITRFQFIEQSLQKENKNIAETSLEEMDEYWEKAKSMEE